MNRPKKPPIPPDLSAVRSGVAAAVDKEVPPNGHGLGPVGEELVQRSLEVEREEQGEKDRHLARFGPDWRGLIQWGNRDPKVVAALRTLLEKQLRRLAIVNALKSSWKLAAIGGGMAFTAIQYSSEAAQWIIVHVPLLRAILKLILGGGP